MITLGNLISTILLEQEAQLLYKLLTFRNAQFTVPWLCLREILLEEFWRNKPYLGSVWLRIVLYTYSSLKGINKDISSTQERSNIVYNYSFYCGSGYVRKTTQRIHLRIDQHVPKILRIELKICRTNLSKITFMLLVNI